MQPEIDTTFHSYPSYIQRKILTSNDYKIRANYWLGAVIATDLIPLATAFSEGRVERILFFGSFSMCLTSIAGFLLNRTLARKEIIEVQEVLTQAEEIPILKHFEVELPDYIFEA